MRPFVPPGRVRIALSRSPSDLEQIPLAPNQIIRPAAAEGEVPNFEVGDVEKGEADELLDVLEDCAPALAGPLADSAVCLYTNTPDGDFILDAHPADTRVLLASPCSGHGFKFAPAIGEIMADLAESRTPRFDLTPFRLSRTPLGEW